MTTAIEPRTDENPVSTDADCSSVRPWEKWLRNPEWTFWKPSRDVTQWEIHWPEGFDSVTRFCVTNWRADKWEAQWVGHRDCHKVFDAVEEAKAWCERMRKREIAKLFEVK